MRRSVLDQKIQFCITPDHLRIAYSTIGTGRALVKVANWLGHLQYDLDSPVLGHWTRELSKYRRIVRYDQRGVGLSDRDINSSTFAEWVVDLETVVDSVGVDKFDLLGISQGGAIAVEYSLRHPDRVRSLILYGASAIGPYHYPLTPEQLQAFQAMLTLTKFGWGQDNAVFRQLFTSRFIPEATAEHMQHFNEFQRMSSSPENAVRFLEEWARIDIRDRLSKVSVPTLVLHSRGDLISRFQDGRELASMIRGARFVPLESQNHLVLENEEAWEKCLGELRNFLGVSDSSIEQLSLSRIGTPQKLSLQFQNRKLISLIENMTNIPLSRYRVVGNYSRYHEPARNLLKDLKQKIISGLEVPSEKHENIIIWAPPGSGKTYFVKQVNDNLVPSVHYCGLNLAEADEMKFRSVLSESDRIVGPSLYFVDEIDSKPESSWPYEVLLPYLEANNTPGKSRVFILAGSTGPSMDNMKSSIATRPKGPDLLSRIPAGNEYTIPPLTPEDRILVTLTTLREAGRQAKKSVAEIEKLALFYVAQRPELDNPRQLREFALRCIERMPKGEDRVKYDNMFNPGENVNKEFWLEARTTVPQLINSYLSIEE